MTIITITDIPSILVTCIMNVVGIAALNSRISPSSPFNLPRWLLTLLMICTCWWVVSPLFWTSEPLRSHPSSVYQKSLFLKKIFCYCFPCQIFGNIFVSMASVAISMRLHATFTELKKRLLKHRHFARISTLLSERYPSAKADQLTDPCAICWELMEAARLLPCTHVFHEYALLTLVLI